LKEIEVKKYAELKWLKENVHQYGATLKPAELIKKVTGEELSAKYLIEYLNDKFGKLYGV
jgi:carboxypeptidase Taq